MQAEGDRQLVALAALLHDIGKFAQRAREPLGDGFRGFDVSLYGRHGAHALHSAQFVERELPPAWRRCLNPILYHHKPQDPLSALVAAGDRFSAAERQSEHVAEAATLQPLRNLLATVWSPDAAPSHFGLRPLDASDPDSFFPSAVAPTPAAQAQGYASLWDGFLAAHRRLEASDFSRYAAGLYSLLQSFTWCIPSAAYGSVPDISLFDHSRTSAAVAIALHDYLDEHQTLHGFRDPASIAAEPCFRLAVGDLSGIQEYLYDVAHVGVGGAARRLRARSLYLQMLTEVACHQLLAAAGLGFLSVLMISGGRFYVMLPNTERAREAMARIQEYTDGWLLRRFGGELALNMASVPLSGADLEGGELDRGFGSVLELAGVKLAERKSVRLREALQDDRGWREDAFLLPGFGGASACRSCRKLPAAGGGELCQPCQTDFDVGRRLPQAAYLAFYAAERPQAPSILGHSVEVLGEHEQPDGAPYLLLSLDDGAIALPALAPRLPRPTCTYVPTYSAADLSREAAVSEEAWPGAPVTFEHLSQRAVGRKVLGFLKADVDRLGESFAFGLKPGRDTSSRLAQMSRMLDLFFGGWLPALLRRRFPDVYSVYAGGDDLLLVGPWDRTLELVTAIVEDFGRLADNPRLHLSAAVMLAKPGYPIARAADGAEEQLRLAKDAGRNRLTVLGHVLTWQEWAAVRGVWRDLQGEANAASAAFIYHLLRYARMWRRYRLWELDRHHPEASVLGLRFQPLLAYDLSRNVDRRQTPGLYGFAHGLTVLRPDDAEQRLLLDNLGLIAQLWILARESSGEGQA